MASNYQLPDTYGMYIGGEWRQASDGATINAFNPANGSALATIPDATQPDVDDAVRAARAAFLGWAETPVQARSRAMLDIADLIQDNLDFLATVESMDNGKPIRETSNADIPLSVDHFRYFAGVMRADEGAATMIDQNTLNIILREPLGVIGQIVPWNFPFLMAAWKLAPALVSGNTVVFKPSSATSLSVLELARLVDEAGILPTGVFNVITGSGGKSGEYLQHADVDKLAFTGSTEVGRRIALAAAEKIIPATLELGGKSASVFFDDADPDVALNGVEMGILFNRGQVCSAGSRIFVQQSVMDDFMARLTNSFENVKIGDPLDPSTQMGAQIDERQLDKILEYVDLGKQEGASLAVGGQRVTTGDLGKGVFMEPTLLVGDNDMRVAREEIFGPVGVVIPFKDEDDVVRMANDSIYGLGGGVFSKSLERAIRVATRVRTGRIWVNQYNAFPAGAPFGGYKNSGIGRETHKMILDAYQQTKNILVNLSGQPVGLPYNLGD
ncbi:aldehyde dehydrogenase family protein [Propionibacterium freudenreichii]|uniref:aldehyde dehydrogenase family protein n=1 Tax=Propionibacterium freudenreichii TaxID=1744 RepID=UPI00254ECD6F|nr:aldehyde dehydrogenase family protein [Propionibacterium freudenreichii]MDK9643467.1 aldehyde dehydrogenase family protein [Propionibacterium freudenreichii]